MSKSKGLDIEEEIKTAVLYTDRITLKPPTKKKIERTIHGKSSIREKILLYFDSLAYTNITTEREEYLSEQEKAFLSTVYANTKGGTFIKEVSLFFKAFTIFKDSIKNTEHKVELISVYLKEVLRETFYIQKFLKDIDRITVDYIPREKWEEVFKSIAKDSLYKKYGGKLVKEKENFFLEIDPANSREKAEESIELLIKKVEDFKLFRDLFDEITKERLPLPSIRQYIQNCSSKVEKTYSEIFSLVNSFNSLLRVYGQDPLVIPTYESIKSEEITAEDIESIKEVGK
jgi:hypothetical protein